MIKIGDKVQIIEIGYYYPTNDTAAREMKATRWTPNNQPGKEKPELF